MGHLNMGCLERIRVPLVLVFIGLAPAMAADGFFVGDEYQADFDKAHSCRPVDGRKFWEGERAFYVQSWPLRTGKSGCLTTRTPVSPISMT